MDEQAKWLQEAGTSVKRNAFYMKRALVRIPACKVASSLGFELWEAGLICNLAASYLISWFHHIWQALLFARKVPELHFVVTCISYAKGLGIQTSA